MRPSGMLRRNEVSGQNLFPDYRRVKAVSVSFRFGDRIDSVALPVLMLARWKYVIIRLSDGHSTNVVGGQRAVPLDFVESSVSHQDGEG